ncbi:MAG: SDR family NAD(P)-dependent oxidoreductase [Desulfobacteraceae bacterium]
MTIPTKGCVIAGVTHVYVILGERLGFKHTDRNNMEYKISLVDKIVLITGASSGIGKELSRRFAMEKAILVIASIPSEKSVLEAWADELRHYYHARVTTLTEDLSTSEGPHNLYRQVMNIVPRIDVLVNNAGIMSFGLFHMISLEEQERIVAVNLRAYMALMRLFIPDMVKRKAGYIFNVSSVSAFVPTPRHAVYGATKAFVQSLTEAVAEELKDTGVTTFTLNPGYTDTPLLRGKNFPKKLRFYVFGGKSCPTTIADKGVDAFKQGKHVYIPEPHLWFLFFVLNRFSPRIVINRISEFMVKGA